MQYQRFALVAAEYFEKDSLTREFSWERYENMDFTQFPPTTLLNYLVPNILRPNRQIPETLTVLSDTQKNRRHQPCKINLFMIIPCSNEPSLGASPQMAEQTCRTAGMATIQNSAPGCWNPLKERWKGWAALFHFLLTPSSNTVSVLTQKWFWPCSQTNMAKTH